MILHRISYVFLGLIIGLWAIAAAGALVLTLPDFFHGQTLLWVRIGSTVPALVLVGFCWCFLKTGFSSKKIA